MQRFACPACAAEVYFDNTECLSCGAMIAYDPRAADFALAHALRPCANRDSAFCNWAAAADGPLCVACAHNRTVPDPRQPGNLDNWRAIEAAKRHLFYSILRWGLPHPTRAERPDDGLAFDFLADGADAEGEPTTVLTGHAAGLITLNIAEGDDAEREARRSAMGEPYRTLIGHMRHEVGHYYWDVLVRGGGRLDDFRALFGDERADYGKALERNYAEGPRPDWADHHISSYASVHPWEDFAETWAHYLHIVDASDTARAFGMRLRVRGAHVVVDTDPYVPGNLDDTLADWVPLTLAMNCLNRAMGQPDLYPFVLNEDVFAKLAFVDSLVHPHATR